MSFVERISYRHGFRKTDVARVTCFWKPLNPG
jgi:hypothetical protein